MSNDITVWIVMAISRISSHPWNSIWHRAAISEVSWDAIWKCTTWRVNPVSKLINEGIKIKFIVTIHHASSPESKVKDIWMKMVQTNKCSEFCSCGNFLRLSFCFWTLFHSEDIYIYKYVYDPNPASRPQSWLSAGCKPIYLVAL